MNSPLTTPSSWRLMTSKIRFLGDGAEGAYLQCYFSQLSSTSSALLGPWKPYPGGIDHAFRPSLGPSRQNKYRPAATVQLLTKKRSIFLSLIVEEKIDMLIFFWDPLTSQPHDPDVKALLRIAALYEVPIACNRASADFLLTSSLINESYPRRQ